MSGLQSFGMGKLFVCMESGSTRKENKFGHLDEYWDGEWDCAGARQHASDGKSELELDTWQQLTRQTGATWKGRNTNQHG